MHVIRCVQLLAVGACVMLKKSFSLALCALTWALSCSAIWAQDWPSKSMRMV